MHTHQAKRPVKPAKESETVNKDGAVCPFMRCLLEAKIFTSEEHAQKKKFVTTSARRKKSANDTAVTKTCVITD